MVSNVLCDFKSIIFPEMVLSCLCSLVLIRLFCYIAFQCVLSPRDGQLRHRKLPVTRRLSMTFQLPFQLDTVSSVTGVKSPYSNACERRHGGLVSHG